MNKDKENESTQRATDGQGPNSANQQETSYTCPMDFDMEVVHNCDTGEIEGIVCKGWVLEFISSI